MLGIQDVAAAGNTPEPSQAQGIQEGISAQNVVIADLTALVSRLLAEVAQLEGEFAALQRQIAALKPPSRSSFATGPEGDSAYQRALSSYRSALSSLRSALNTKISTLQSKRSSLASAKSRLQAAQNELKNLERELQTAQFRDADARRKAEQALRTAQEQARRLQEQVQRAERQLQESQRQMEQAATALFTASQENPPEAETLANATIALARGRFDMAESILGTGNARDLYDGTKNDDQAMLAGFATTASGLPFEPGEGVGSYPALALTVDTDGRPMGIPPETWAQLSERHREAILAGIAAHPTAAAFGQQGTIPPGGIVDPGIAGLPLDQIRQEIREQVMSTAMPGPDNHIPPEYMGTVHEAALKEADQAVAAFDALYAEALKKYADPHALAEDRVGAEEAAREEAIRRLNLGHSGGVGQVDFNKMTEEQQFNYLRAEIEARGGAFRTGNNEVNIIGVRGLENGVPGDNAPNEYNDTIFVLRYEYGQPRVYEFQATTDFGDTSAVLAHDQFGVLEEPPDGPERRIPLLMAEGTYQLGLNPEGDHIMRERDGTGVISVADVNDNRRVDPDELANYAHTDKGINLHDGGAANRPVADRSAGCQVIPTRPAGDTSSTLYYAEFEAMIREDPTYAKAYEALHQKGATQADIHPYVQYTLADVTTLPSTR